MGVLHNKKIKCETLIHPLIAEIIHGSAPIPYTFQQLTKLFIYITKLLASSICDEICYIELYMRVIASY